MTRPDPTTKTDRRHAADETHRPTISAAERRRRREAVEDARASVYLSGLPDPTPEEAAHEQRYIDGEIDMPELVKGPSDE